MRPDLLVATNSPRAERAAIVEARALGIPAVCIVDLFAIDEVRWIGQAGYADRICVLNEAVRDFLVAAGRSRTKWPSPAIRPSMRCSIRRVRAGRALRREHGWEGKRVLLWPAQVEPALHPFNGGPGDPALPARALQAAGRLDPGPARCGALRPARAGQRCPRCPPIRASSYGQDWPLPPLLHAVDLVVTLTPPSAWKAIWPAPGWCRCWARCSTTRCRWRASARRRRVPVAELAAALDQVSRAGRHAGATGRTAGAPKRRGRARRISIIDRLPRRPDSGRFRPHAPHSRPPARDLAAFAAPHEQAGAATACRGTCTSASAA